MAQGLLHKIDANDKSYEIKEVHKRYPDSDEPQFLQLKIIRGYDALIKNDQFYFLCNEISDANYTDIPNAPESESVNKINEEIKELDNLNI